MADLVKVLKAVEWWASGDTGVEDYHAAVVGFHKKWLRREPPDFDFFEAEAGQHERAEMDAGS